MMIKVYQEISKIAQRYNIAIMTNKQHDKGMNVMNIQDNTYEEGIVWGIFSKHHANQNSLFCNILFRSKEDANEYIVDLKFKDVYVKSLSIQRRAV